MALRIERDPAFWSDVVSHPAVAHVMQGEPSERIGFLVGMDHVTPLANAWGGYIYIRLDSFGRVLELHTLLQPEGWGRRAIEGGAESLEWMFRTADLVITHTVLDWPRSRPWKSFGFAPCGDPFEARGLTLQTWALPKMVWQASLARKRLCLSPPRSLQ